MPLEGLRVVDAATILAGPLCAQILGDYGADVIKVEHPSRGDSMRGHGYSKNDVPLWWKEISRNKRTVALDLKSPEGGEVFRRLAATADEPQRRAGDGGPTEVIERMTEDGQAPAAEGGAADRLEKVRVSRGGAVRVASPASPRSG